LSDLCAKHCRNEPARFKTINFARQETDDPPTDKTSVSPEQDKHLHRLSKHLHGTEQMCPRVGTIKRCNITDAPVTTTCAAYIYSPVYGHVM
jgi:hypothetical protein